jgi:thiamine-phosphate pyrophosphorylase
MRGLYAITPDIADTAELARRVEQALKAGVALLQYRNKAISKDKRLLQARELAPLARGYGVPFIVNDDVDIALAVGANGAHLGKDDGDIAAARAQLSGRIVGTSCYADLEKAKAAVRAGADYVAFGSVFPSPTKPQAVRAPLSLLNRNRLLREVPILFAAALQHLGHAIELAGDGRELRELERRQPGAVIALLDAVHRGHDSLDGLQPAADDDVEQAVRDDRDD